MSLTLYRRSLLGENLSATLAELKESQRISESLELKTLECFDQFMCETISKRHKNKCNIKGDVISFKNCDDIWIFYGKNVSLKTERESFTSPNLKIVACDVKMKENMINNNKHYQDISGADGEDNN